MELDEWQTGTPLWQFDNENNNETFTIRTTGDKNYGDGDEDEEDNEDGDCDDENEENKGDE